MKEAFVAFKDSNGFPTAIKTLGSSVSYIDSEHINNGRILAAEPDGNGFIGIKVVESGFTLSVTCQLYFGPTVGYGPLHDLLDESSTRVKTFDSTKVFQASLYNQNWFNANHQGFKYRITKDSGSGDCTVYSEGTTS